MQIYKRWRIIFLAESLLVVLSLIFLGRQSWSTRSVKEIGRADSPSGVLTYDSSGKLLLPGQI